MVSETGLVKILDFGLAKLTERREATEDDATQSLHLQTDAGTVMGTAAYMSPEQAAGKPAGARSDIFSFGAVLYEMATGRRAFPGDSQAAIMAAVLNKEAKPRADHPRRRLRGPRVAGWENSLYTKTGGDERQVLESVARRGFAVFEDGIYYLYAGSPRSGEM